MSSWMNQVFHPLALKKVSQDGLTEFTFLIVMDVMVL